MSLLSHLFCWFHAKTDVTSDKARESNINITHYMHEQLVHAWTKSYTQQGQFNRQTADMIFECKVLMKRVYPACNPQTYIFLATSVSLNCSFTMTAARSRSQRVKLIYLCWYMRTPQRLMKVSSDPSATCSTAYFDDAACASMSLSWRLSASPASHLRTATPADRERSEKYILIRSLVIKIYIWIRSSYIWMSVNYIHFGSYFSMFWKVRSDMVVDVCIFRHGH